MTLMLDPDACVKAVRARDARFDGRLYVGVTSTGIYCRPSCPAPPPKREHLTFHPTAAAAQRAGFRACRRCRPEASPGSPDWNIREDTAARAMRLIADGEVDRSGVEGLSAALGYSSRQVERVLRGELGAGPLALARAQRASTARTLIEGTALSFSEIAFAAGFASVRSFNETIRAVFAASPSQLRTARRNGRAAAIRPTPVAPHLLTLRLAYRPPLHVPSLFGHLIATAVPGVDTWHPQEAHGHGSGGVLHRAMRLPHGAGVASLRPDDGHRGWVEAQLRLTDLRDLTSAVQRCRRMLDLDADPVGIEDALRTDEDFAPLVARFPGCRLPGSPDPEEQAFRVVLGQQISTQAAGTMGARLTRAFGEPLPEALLLPGGPTHLFPTAASLTTAEDDARWPGMPASRRATLRGLAEALTTGKLRLDVGAPWSEVRRELTSLRGIGPWSVEMIALRGLGDPDAFPATDLGTRLAAEALGLPGDPRPLAGAADAWRPWRSYATALLWASSDHAVARLPQNPSPQKEPLR
ncbi:DNA-3-methyladenine glycosylase 2 family protein [Nesterenkonia sp. HG001]|uniref:DNA-3-methyladenine glycosylase 2 family protein n=1 Tax=Nesterenkonia sp. HG001 TaxID=2983207 RepID=UPI002ACC287E|nr:AlkA N-terminal domain-containing protein [Nesterenkonia sp. HG001]